MLSKSELKEIMQRANEECRNGKISTIERFRQQNKAVGYMDEATSEVYKAADRMVAQGKEEVCRLIEESVETVMMPMVQQYVADISCQFKDHLEREIDRALSEQSSDREQDERTAEIREMIDRYLRGTSNNVTLAFEVLRKHMPCFRLG